MLGTNEMIELSAGTALFAVSGWLTAKTGSPIIGCALFIFPTLFGFVLIEDILKYSIFAMAIASIYVALVFILVAKFYKKIIDQKEHSH